MTRVAIVGAGPGGLMTAHLIARKYGDAFRPTLFEASHWRQAANAPLQYRRCSLRSRGSRNLRLQPTRR